MVRIKTHRVNLKILFAMLTFFVVCNEIYRYFEVSRLKHHGCSYAGIERKSVGSGINAKRRVREFFYLYHCDDGVERTSIYNIERFVRPWE